ncbi:MAG: type II toxin-antitoxin system RelE/ParE family toxin [Deltaproteobacteria bacterium]|nr:type II toxin-antitoxin system RelE/ParE family toxin [Deltaproteobacteria bacterium]
MKYTYDFAEVNGKVPMIEFLDSLSAKERAKIFAYLEKLVELKNNAIHPKENLSKHLEDGIFELRVSFENRISRSFYFYEAERQIIFTHGFVKKEQKTPKIEIEKAKAIRESWRGEK